MSFGLDLARRSYRNLSLSFRGSERQAPNLLQLALRFSRIMEQKANDGLHLPSATTEERLKDVLQEFHSSPGMTAKHRLDDEKCRSVLNLIAGTSSAPWLIDLAILSSFGFHFRCLEAFCLLKVCSAFFSTTCVLFSVCLCSRMCFPIWTLGCQDAPAILQKHIDHVKWAQCAFSTEQLKGQRWMVGSTPKNCPPS